ncbi:DUF6221 family protein [Streptomyces sp. NPDC001185]|uniref:DUF6221 family protein n=1 Tax=Streptomyces sp. NPDC001185 TaxID=3154380 RepID=UPI00332F6469
MTFRHARLDEEADLARRGDGDGDGRGEWTAGGHTVECQAELSGVRPAIVLHIALHGPARVLREAEAGRRVRARHVLGPAVGGCGLPWDNRDDCRYDGETWPCDGLPVLASPCSDHLGHPRCS